MSFGTGLISNSVTTIVVKFVPHRSPSTVALSSLDKYMFADVGGAVTQPLVTAKGSGWFYTGLGLITLLNMLVVLPVYKKG